MRSSTVGYGKVDYNSWVLNKCLKVARDQQLERRFQNRL
jgi:hypothetical protein